jgi:hypothetical protein
MLMQCSVDVLTWRHSHLMHAHNVGPVQCCVRCCVADSSGAAFCRDQPITMHLSLLDPEAIVIGRKKQDTTVHPGVTQQMLCRSMEYKAWVCERSRL